MNKPTCAVVGPLECAQWTKRVVKYRRVNRGLDAEFMWTLAGIASTVDMTVWQLRGCFRRMQVELPRDSLNQTRGIRFLPKAQRGWLAACVLASGEALRPARGWARHTGRRDRSPTP